MGCKMRKNDILEELHKVETGLTIEELSEKLDIPISRLRVNLYRLQEEGEVESREEKEELKWETKTSEPIEDKYEKMSKKHK